MRETVNKGAKRAGGYFLLATGFLACPCHLPLLALLLGGTFLGVFLKENLGLLLLASGLYFVGALFLGLRMVRRGNPPSSAEGACCAPPGGEKGFLGDFQERGFTPLTGQAGREAKKQGKEG